MLGAPQLGTPADLHGVVSVLLLQVVAFGLAQGPSFVKRKAGLLSEPPPGASLEVVGLLAAGLWYLLVLGAGSTAWYSRNRSEVLTLGHWFFAALNALAVAREPPALWAAAVLRCALPALQAALAFSDSPLTSLLRLGGMPLIFTLALLILRAEAAAYATLPVLLAATAAAATLAQHWKLLEEAHATTQKPKPPPGKVLDPADSAPAPTAAGPLPSPEGPPSEGGSPRPNGMLTSPVIPMRQNSLQRNNTSLAEALAAATRAVQAVEQAALQLAQPTPPQPGRPRLPPTQQGQRAPPPQPDGPRSAPGQQDQRAPDPQAVNPPRGAGWEELRMGRPPPTSSVIPGVPSARQTTGVCIEQALGASASGISFNIGAEVARLTSLCKVMELEEATVFVERSQWAMAGGPQEQEEGEAESSEGESEGEEGEGAEAEGVVEAAVAVQRRRPSVVLQVVRRQRARVSAARRRAENSSSSSGEPASQAAPLSEALIAQARTTLSALGYDVAVRKWQESRVEVRALEAIHCALLRPGLAEADLTAAVLRVRNARLGLVALGVASAGREPWKALRRRAAQRTLLMGALWTAEHWSMAEDTGRTAWLAESVPTATLLQGMAPRVFPPLGPQQLAAVAAIARDMDRVEESLSQNFAMLLERLQGWLAQGGRVDAASPVGQLIGGFGEEVEALVQHAEECQVVLFEALREVMTPLQMATLLLLMVEHRAGVQKLGSFWEGCAKGDDVLTGVRKMLGAEDEDED